MKLLKIFTASLLSVSLGVATVVCCCVAPAVMAHLHKASVCTHCLPQKSSQGHSSAPGDNCMYQLTNADAFHHQTISSPVLITFTPHTFFNKHVSIPFLSSSISTYPRGSPPLTASFVPLYLRTFSLRI